MIPMICGQLISFLLLALFMCHSKGGDLTVKEGQYYLKDARPFRGVGVNYFDAINRSINNPQDISAIAGLAELKKHDVPFVRVMFGGFWPAELKLYETDPISYFAVLDRFVRAAEEHGIGIVASLAWNYAAIPDLVNEPMDAWGQPNSKTTAYFNRYVSAVVDRYKASPAIWMWEFGNEMALYVDLPNAKEWRPKVNVAKGTPSLRRDTDDLSGRDQSVAYSNFVSAVRKVDAKTPLSTGNALPRPYAFNNWRNRSWQADNREQFCDMLLRDNPEGFDVISVHAYPHNRGYFDRGRVGSNVEDALAAASTCAKRVRRPIFLGEFGVSDDDPAVKGRSSGEVLKGLLGTIEKEGIGLAALWVYDFPFHEATINVTATNKRAYQLDMLRQINKRLRTSN
ncbi:cellulase family glycosylhydrolase [Aquincola sp. MAHUQ-54]|uniref:mannan endo-1,4-beta-mannosidase n=1 Tax=Aquincola agrisoli TaxID=3119538 RepID=A0AAW9QI33_9BURK